jgi:phage host-nuclease inhibitor protein Gam
MSDRGRVVEAIMEIGKRQRELDLLQAGMSEGIAEVKGRYEREAAPHAEAVRALTKDVREWCEAHREELTEGGRIKRVRMGSGDVRWRMRPPKVSIRGADEVMRALKSLGLERFIRVKEEINKDAILNEADAVRCIQGVSIVQEEDFVIAPHGREADLGI